MTREAADLSINTAALTTDAIALEVSGAIDLLTAPAMAEALEHAQRDYHGVRLDLRGVEFLGSAGLSVLVDAARKANETAGRLAIVTSGHAVRRAVEVTGLDEVLQLFDEVSPADEYLAQ